MAALTNDRDTHKRIGAMYQDPVSGGARIFAGAMVVLDASGNAKPAHVATGLTPRGMALKEVDNRLGAAGDMVVDIESGIFALKTDASISRTDIGHKAYFLDDQTVAATDGSGTRSEAGIIKDVEGAGYDAIAWVQVG